MPRTFTNDGVVSFAEMMKYRKQKEGESIDEYRAAIADLHQDKDPVEAQEIRTGKGWDEWSRGQETNLLSRMGIDIHRQIAITQGHVPADCTLPGALIMIEVGQGRSPCWGCNISRGECGGQPKRPHP